MNEAKAIGRAAVAAGGSVRINACACSRGCGGAGYFTRIFKQLDVESSGFVDRDELLSHLKRTVGLSYEVAKRLFNDS